MKRRVISGSGSRYDVMRFACYIFLLVIVSCMPDGSQPFRSETVVALQPLGSAEEGLLAEMKTAIRQIYGFEVLVLPERPMPREAFVNLKSPRYRADKLIGWLKSVRPDAADFILGITNSDISTTKRDASGQIKEPKWKYEDWGIMGLGFRPGPSCVVSAFRLKTNDKTLFRERLKKVAVHELGHNLGLPHCPNSGCVMNDANESIKTIDRAKLELCAKCREEI